jgi:hypothetical protein
MIVLEDTVLGVSQQDGTFSKRKIHIGNSLHAVNRVRAQNSATRWIQEHKAVVEYDGMESRMFGYLCRGGFCKSSSTVEPHRNAVHTILRFESLLHLADAMRRTCLYNNHLLQQDTQDNSDSTSQATRQTHQSTFPPRSTWHQKPHLVEWKSPPSPML